jgi:T5SS/PEP-CTERM-associated repeat protein
MKRPLYVTIAAAWLLFSNAANCQVGWEGDLDTNWSTDVAGDTNWSGNVIPAAPDDVVIGFGNVDLTSANATINSLDVSGNVVGNTPLLEVASPASLLVTTSTLVGGAAGLTGQLDVTTAALSPQTIFQSASLTVGRGLAAQGLVNLTGANFTVSGNLTVGENAGTGNFSSSTGVDPTQRSNVSTGRVFVGRGENSKGEVHLVSTDYVQTISATVGFGLNATASFDMTDVTATTGSFNAGFSASSSGSISTTDTDWTLNGFLRIGYDGSGQVTLGSGSHVTVNTTTDSASVMIGERTGSNGYLEVSASGNGSSSLTANKQITVGYAGNGELFISGNTTVSSGPGASPTNSALILGNLNSEGILTISNQGRYEAAAGSDAIIGFVGKGTANINSGGVFSARDMEVARETGSEGNVFVSGGNGSQIELDRALYIGGSDTAQGGLAKVEVIEDSRILVGEKIQLWKSDSTLSLVSSNPAVSGGAVGVGVVDQALLTSGMLSVFQDGLLQGAGTLEGSLTVYNGGIVAPGNSSGILTVTETTTLETGSILDIGIGGQVLGSEYDQLVTDTFESNGGTIRVTLVGLYVPSFGHSFQIVNAGTFDLAGIFFNFSSAPLTPGLSWDTDAFALNGTISVIPEPSVAGLLGLGSLLFLRRQRR